jgi:hypothetical protein
LFETGNSKYTINLRFEDGPPEAWRKEWAKRKGEEVLRIPDVVEPLATFLTENWRVKSLLPRCNGWWP